MWNQTSELGLRRMSRSITHDVSPDEDLIVNCPLGSISWRLPLCFQLKKPVFLTENSRLAGYEGMMVLDLVQEHGKCLYKNVEDMGMSWDRVVRVKATL